MPRGVPASGKRQPRAVAAVDDTAETAMASSALDEEERIDEAFGNEVETPDFPAAEELAALAENELTPEQQEIKRLRDLLAQKRGREDVEPAVEPFVVDPARETILIHFLEDGLSALGRVWYRGQELEFQVGSQAYKDTFNRLGQTWLDLRADRAGQFERFGKVMFWEGAWPGKTYLDGSFEPLRGGREGSRVATPSDDELAAAEKARQRRAAPHLPQQI